LKEIHETGEIKIRNQEGFLFLFGPVVWFEVVWFCGWFDVVWSEISMKWSLASRLKHFFDPGSCSFSSVNKFLAIFPKFHHNFCLFSVLKSRNLDETNENITLAEWLTSVDNGFDYQTTNGLVFPILTIPTGQRKRFRYK